MVINEATIRMACEELADLLVAKNKDYGNSVQEQFEEYGETSLLIRLDDKVRRLKQLRKAPANVNSESKQETMIDVAGYAVLGLLCLRSSPYEELTKLPMQRHDMNFNPTPPYFDADDQ